MTTVKKTVKKATFASLSPSQKRVAIAEDVIAGLNAKRLKATQGAYVVGEAKLHQTMEEIDNLTGPKQVELKDVLAEMKTCEVCAKGAMFIAAVERFDKLKIDLYDNDDKIESNAKGEAVLTLGAFDGDDEVCDHLTKYFSQEQLDMVELAFEGKDYYGDEIDDLDHALALTYQFRFKKPTDRMIAIMKNIVSNDGKFIPSILDGKKVLDD